MPVYDLMLKLEGMKALCGDGVTDNELAMALFRFKWEGELKSPERLPIGADARPPEEKAAQSQRSDLSRLKSGKLEFSQRLKSILTEEFNARVTKNVLPRNNDGPPDNIGLLRNDDWDRPIHEFFSPLAKYLGEKNPAALQRAHSAIAAAIHGLRKYREHDHALLIADYDPADADSYRFPASAPAVDPNPLPPVNIRAGKPMIAALTRPVCERMARGWLFYVRDPDMREGVAQTHFIWDQDLNDMVHWHPNGPFEIQSDYVGPLPGFPATATTSVGEITAYLLVEPLDSPAIADLLRTPNPSWTIADVPSFDGFANLVTADQRLFQEGNVKSFAKGSLAYPPPRLYLRRYRIHA